MMYGVELRNPFLDHRLTELSFMISANRKITNGYTKYCLRQAASSMLPQDIAFHIKRQVQTPQREWLKTELNEDESYKCVMCLYTVWKIVYEHKEEDVVSIEETLHALDAIVKAGKVPIFKT